MYIVIADGHRIHFGISVNVLWRREDVSSVEQLREVSCGHSLREFSSSLEPLPLREDFGVHHFVNEHLQIYDNIDDIISLIHNKALLTLYTSPITCFFFLTVLLTYSWEMQWKFHRDTLSFNSSGVILTLINVLEWGFDQRSSFLFHLSRSSCWRTSPEWLVRHSGSLCPSPLLTSLWQQLISHRTTFTCGRPLRFSHTRNCEHLCNSNKCPFQCGQSDLWSKLDTWFCYYIQWNKRKVSSSEYYDSPVHVTIVSLIEDTPNKMNIAWNIFVIIMWIVFSFYSFYNCIDFLI